MGVRKRGSSVFYLLFSFISGLLILFIILPLTQTIISPSPRLIAEQVADPEVMESILNSLSLAIVTAIIACIFGIPLAYILARKKFWGKAVIEAIVDLPLAIPHTVAGIALLSVFGRKAFLGAPLEQYFGLTFMGTRIAVVTAMLFVSLPYMVNSVRDGFEAISERLEQVGRTLGASSFGVFRRISLPLVQRSIFTGMVLTWARAISEFGAVIVVAYYPMTAPVKIWDVFTTTTLEKSSAVAALLLIVCLLGFVVFRLLAYKKRD